MKGKGAPVAPFLVFCRDEFAMNHDAEQEVRPRVVLLMGPATYRANAFLAAAERLGLNVAQGIDVPAPMTGEWRVTLGLDFNEPEVAAQQVADYVATHPAQAILAVD